MVPRSFYLPTSKGYEEIANLNDFVMVYVTTSSKAEAEKIVHTVLNEQIIACANIIGSMSSYFHWDGKIDSAEECLVIMKTRLDLFVALESRVKALHSYEVPEILAVPIVDGSKKYFDWINSAFNR